MGNGQLFKENVIGGVSDFKAEQNFSRREAAIIRMMAVGMTNKEIAGSLIISPETVKTQVSRLIKKLKARNRTEAVANAVNVGLLTTKPTSAIRTSAISETTMEISVSYEKPSNKEETYIASFPVKPTIIK